MPQTNGPRTHLADPSWRYRDPETRALCGAVVTGATGSRILTHGVTCRNCIATRERALLGFQNRGHAGPGARDPGVKG